MDILKLPFTNSSEDYNLGDTSGCRAAPNALNNLYNEHLRKKVFFKRTQPVLNFLEWYALPLSPNHIAAVQQFFAQNPGVRVGVIGGDHHLTSSCFSAFWQWQFLKDSVFLLSLDAHPDLTWKQEPDGREPLHSDWLRNIIDRRFLNPKQVIGLGWRDIEPEEDDYIKEKSILYYSPEQLKDADTVVLDLIKPNRLRPKKSETYASKSKVYLTIDLDVLSPAFAPGVSAPSHFGLTDRELINLIRKLDKTFDILAFDIMELNPSRDVNGVTASLALQILYELCPA